MYAEFRVSCFIFFDIQILMLHHTTYMDTRHVLLYARNITIGRFLSCHTIAMHCGLLFLSRAPVTHLLQTHLPTHVFLPIITRDTPDLLPKPDPAGILHIAREWGLDNRADSLIMVSIIRLEISSSYLPRESLTIRSYFLLRI